MREIKFRAWNKDNKRMIVPDNRTLFGDGNKMIYDDADIFIMLAHSRDDYKFMQYTGLKDKNGKEIYFGDILQTSNNDGSDGFDIWDKKENGYTICYENTEELGVLFTNWCPTFDNKSIYDMEYCEVIGNIYENPELLKS